MRAPRERQPLRILILGLNYAPESIGFAVYGSGLAEAMAAMGQQIDVIAGQPYYPAWKVMPGYRNWTRSTQNGVRVMCCPHCVPARPTGVRRVLHHLSFAFSMFLPAIIESLRTRPDVVLAIAPSVLAGPFAVLAAFVGGFRSWLHVQDFEVDAAPATRLIEPGRGARLADWLERTALAAFQRVSSISPRICARLGEKGVQ